MSKNIALIFARGGSKGIKKKNIKLLNGKPLISHTLELAINSKIFKHVYVSTENKSIAKIALSLGAKIIKRPKYLATDLSPELESWKHAMRHLKKEKILFDKVAILPVTAPLRNLSDIKKGIKLLQKNIDMIISVNNTDRHPYFNMVKINKNGLVSIAIKKRNIARRQDAPLVYNMTTVIYVTTASYITKTSNILSGRVKALKVPIERALDIDTPHDFHIAELIMTNKEAKQK